jgi:hypothetical protein
MNLIAPVAGSLALAIECKRLSRSKLLGSIEALRKAADILEGI